MTTDRTTLRERINQFFYYYAARREQPTRDRKRAQIEKWWDHQLTQIKSTEEYDIAYSYLIRLHEGAVLEIARWWDGKKVRLFSLRMTEKAFFVQCINDDPLSTLAPALTIATTCAVSDPIAFASLRKYIVEAVENDAAERLRLNPQHVCGAMGFGRGGPSEKLDVCPACEVEKKVRTKKGLSTQPDWPARDLGVDIA